MTDITPLLGKVHNGDNLPQLKAMPDNSVHAVVVDPPYGLSFMGKHWDYDVPQVETWREVLRVLKPGGYILCFGGSRTFHRIVVNIEDAGFEIRDTIFWCYGSGFPKSHDISKGIDKQKGCFIAGDITANSRAGVEGDEGGFDHSKVTRSTNPQSDEAKQWQGWGTALKPAVEPICVARKPISEATVAANVLKWGTGGINIDGCRVVTEDTTGRKPAMCNNSKLKGTNFNTCISTGSMTEDWKLGRWPANLIHDGSEEVLAGFPETKSGQLKPEQYKSASGNNNSIFAGKGEFENKGYDKDSGSAARFFYCAKTSKTDRDDGLDCEEKPCGMMEDDNYPIKTGSGNLRETKRKNTHPTVKPTALMAYLCRLITPPNGIVLDPYSGSGSTGKAATLEGFRFIGMEREAEYCTIANARIAWAVAERIEREVQVKKEAEGIIANESKLTETACKGLDDIRAAIAKCKAKP